MVDLEWMKLYLYLFIYVCKRLYTLWSDAKRKLDRVGEKFMNAAECYDKVSGIVLYAL